MDDLAGLDLSGRSTPSSGKRPPVIPVNPSSYYVPALQPSISASTSTSGRSTPLFRPSALPASSSSLPPSKSSTPANDSFSNLVSFNSSKSSEKLSLLERQRQLQEEKERQAAERQKAIDLQFGSQNNDFWNTLGQPSPLDVPKTNGSPLVPVVSASTARSKANESPDDDILAAFSAKAPVDASSHFAPPSTTAGPANSTLRSLNHTQPTSQQLRNDLDDQSTNDDDDPFGLGQLASHNAPAKRPQQPPALDDDVLGLLGRPVSELAPTINKSPPLSSSVDESDPPSGQQNPRDHAVASLVDMGFPADKAREALAHTDTGINVQAATSWLLNEAHRKARSKSNSNKQSPARPAEMEDENSQVGTTESRERRADRSSSATPAWMRTGGQSVPRRHGSDQEQGSNEKDISLYAAEVGTNLLKSANSLWKSGRKKVQKAVTELQNDGDTGQPKWMRDAELRESSRNERRDPERANQSGFSEDQSMAPSRGRMQEKITDEALLLESSTADSRRTVNTRLEERPRRNLPIVGDPQRVPFPADRNGSTGPGRSFGESARAQGRESPALAMRGRLNKQTIEEQSAQAYVSPARRKKEKAPKLPEADLMFDSISLPPKSSEVSRQSSNASSSPRHAAQPKAVASMSSASTSRTRTPQRVIPAVSSHALSQSSSSREKATEAFKRGDYALAHQLYSNALSPLPQNHPVSIIILCNRALVNLKVGDPKAAMSDSETALSMIGPSRGDGEKIALGNGDGEKEMKEFYGRALTRKAEALEQMERWSDASAAWKEAVEAGVGGATAIQGRDRSLTAAGGGTKSKAPATRRPLPVRKPAVKKPSALSDMAGSSNQSTGSSAEAVRKLRQANAAAEKVDDEKFALADTVDAKLTQWKGGKQDNLRALLGSLDTVLWPEAGWKKVGMHELVMAKKVKIVYMKGIGKVHPDKLSQTASTEQKMISAAVFSTLNEAWDKFKKENGL